MSHRKCDQTPVEHAIMELIADKDFDGYLLTRFDTRIVETLPTEVQTAALMYQNGRFFIRIGEEFFKKLSEKERVAVLKHEVAHFVQKHMSRRNGRDPRLANISMDMAINQFIPNLPDDCVTLPKGEGWDANEAFEVYYDKLEKEVKKQQNGGSKQKSNKSSNQKSKSSGQGPISIPDLFDEVVDAPAEAGAESESMADEIIRETIKERLDAGADLTNMRGLHAGALEDYIEELTAPPMIDWKHALSRFAASLADVQNRMTLKRPDRRQLSPFGRRKEYLPSLVICVDTSGSVSNELLQKFFSQIALLSRQLSEIEVVIADADVQDHFTYRKGMERKLMHSGYGRGGTDFDPAVKYINQNLTHCDGAVYLTDGYCPVPETKCKIPMIWIVTDSEDFAGKPKIMCPDESKRKRRGW